jgi:hypothetical protein
MAVKIEHFDHAIPHGLSLKHLCDGNALDVRGLRSVELVNHVA